MYICLRRDVITVECFPQLSHHDANIYT